MLKRLKYHIAVFFSVVGPGFITAVVDNLGEVQGVVAKGGSTDDATLHVFLPKQAVDQFERRFRGMEDLARLRGADFAALNLDQQEALWRDVKTSEPNKAS